MACTISADEIKRVKGQGFLNQKGTDLFNGRVITVNGKITADQALVIAEAAKLYGDGTMMFTTRLTVEVSGIHFDNIPAFQEYVAKAGLVTGGTGAMVRPVVSCKATTCQYGLYDAYSLSEKIHERFYLGYHGVRLPHKFKIACGGCPNNCVKPDLNDLGIIGQMIPTVDAESCRSCKNCKIMAVCPMGAAGMDENGTLALDDAVCKKCGRCVGKCPFNATPEGTPAFKICIGGRWGKKGAQGLALNRMFTSEEEVLNVVEKAILFYREQGKIGERFGDTIARLGFEYCEKEILSDEILQRKQAILDAADLPMSR
ncbi:MAG: (4Fe-4S)-binding protein [Oscillospiraceae bacterium]|nr:(4Fe-4S)-binding protein [Oscillospiraceae bacterium]